MQQLESATVLLSSGDEVVIDLTDVRLIEPFRWHRFRSNRGSKTYAYATVRVGGKKTSLFMHRLIMNAKPGQEIDHIDGNGLNNHRSNLRFATRSQNEANKPPRADNTHGFKGVSTNKAGTRWYSKLQFQKRSIHIGAFDTKDDAARAYDRKARELWGEFAYLNFPEDHGDTTS